MLSYYVAMGTKPEGRGQSHTSQCGKHAHFVYRTSRVARTLCLPTFRSLVSLNFATRLRRLGRRITHGLLWGLCLIGLCPLQPASASRHTLENTPFRFVDQLTDQERDIIYDEQLEVLKRYLGYGAKYFAAEDCKSRGYERDTEGWADCILVLTPFYTEKSDEATEDAVVELAKLIADRNVCTPQCPGKKKLMSGMKIEIGGDHPAGGGYCNGLVINGRCYGSTFVEGKNAQECYGDWAAGRCENDYFAEDE